MVDVFSRLSQRQQVIVVVTFYMMSALVMVFVNKAVLNRSPNLPLSFLMAQTIIAVILLHLAELVLPATFNLPRLNAVTSKLLLPMIITGVLGLGFNALCLAQVDASFFIVARGLALPFTILFATIYKRRLPTRGVLLSATIVTFGFCIGIYRSNVTSLSSGTVAVSRASIIFGIMSSVVVALHAILIKTSAAHVNNSVIALTYYTNVLSLGFLVPMIIINDEVVALRSLIGPSQSWKPFAIGALITGFFGFFIGIAGLMSIKVTSPVTHMFSSAARSVLQTLLGAFFFNEVISTTRASSIGLITLGAIGYTWALNRGMSIPMGSDDEKRKLKDTELGEDKA